MSKTAAPADDAPLTPRQRISLAMLGGSCLITIGLAFEHGWRSGLTAIAASLLLGATALGLSNMRSSGRGTP